MSVSSLAGALVELRLALRAATDARKARMRRCGISGALPDLLRALGLRDDGGAWWHGEEWIAPALPCRTEEDAVRLIDQISRALRGCASGVEAPTSEELHLERAVEILRSAAETARSSKEGT